MLAFQPMPNYESCNSLSHNESQYKSLHFDMPCVSKYVDVVVLNCKCLLYLKH